MQTMLHDMTEWGDAVAEMLRRLERVAQTIPGMPLVSTTFLERAAALNPSAIGYHQMLHWHSVVSGMIKQLKQQQDQIVSLAPTPVNMQGWQAQRRMGLPKPKKMTHQNIERYLYSLALQKLAEKNLKRMGTNYFRRVIIVTEDGRRVDTTAYEVDCSIAEFVTEFFKEGQPDSIQHLMVTYHLGVPKTVQDALMRHMGDSAPRLVCNRQVCAFRNGVVNWTKDEFVTYAQGVPPGWFSANRFMDMDYQFHPLATRSTVVDWLATLQHYLRYILSRWEGVWDVARSIAGRLKTDYAQGFTLSAAATTGDLEALDTVLQRCRVAWMTPVKQAMCDESTWFRRWVLDDIAILLEAHRTNRNALDVPAHCRPDILVFLPHLKYVLLCLFTQRFSWEEIVWMFGVGFGRLWFPLQTAHSRPFEDCAMDSWQYALFLWGEGGTGKSTLKSCWLHLLHVHDYMSIATSADPTFAFGGLHEKALIWVIHEMLKTATLPMSNLNALISGEAVHVNQKYVVATEVILGARGIACANSFPPSTRAERGSTLRRIYPVYFALSPEANSSLDDLIKGDAPYFGHIAARLYKILVRYIGGRDPMQAAPPKFREMHRGVAMEQNDAAKVIFAMPMVFGSGHTTYCPVSIIMNELKSHGLRDVDAGDVAGLLNASMENGTRRYGNRMRSEPFFIGLDMRPQAGKRTYSDGITEIPFARWIDEHRGPLCADVREEMPMEEVLQRTGIQDEKEVLKDLKLMGFIVRPRGLVVRWRERVYAPQCVVEGLKPVDQ